MCNLEQFLLIQEQLSAEIKSGELPAFDPKRAWLHDERFSETKWVRELLHELWTESCKIACVRHSDVQAGWKQWVWRNRAWTPELQNAYTANKNRRLGAAFAPAFA